MRTSPAVLLASVAVFAGVSVLDPLTARAEFEREIEHLRPLVEDPRFASSLDEYEAACLARLDALDEALDRIAPFGQGVGAQWMWTPVHREELFALAADAAPYLEELARLCAERSDRPPIPGISRISADFTRTNLFCVSALVEGDDARARDCFLRALDVALLVDNGGAWGLSSQLWVAGLVAKAARQRARRHGVDAELVCLLTERFARILDRRSEFERHARDLVRLERAGEYREWGARTARELSYLATELHHALTSGDFASFVGWNESVPQEGWRSVSLLTCGSGSVRILERLRLR